MLTGSSGIAPYTSSPSGRAPGPKAPARASLGFVLKGGGRAPSEISGSMPLWRGGRVWKMPFPTTGKYSSPGSSATS